MTEDEERQRQAESFNSVPKEAMIQEKACDVLFKDFLIFRGQTSCNARSKLRPLQYKPCECTGDEEHS